jgi:hypothetical protein
LFLLAFEPSASVATGARLRVTKDEDGDWLLLATRGWRGFCLLHGYLLKSKTFSHAYKNHDCPEAGGYLQASQYGQHLGFMFCGTQRNNT